MIQKEMEIYNLFTFQIDLDKKLLFEKSNDQKNYSKIRTHYFKHKFKNKSAVFLNKNLIKNSLNKVLLNFSDFVSGAGIDTVFNQIIDEDPEVLNYLKQVKKDLSKENNATSQLTFNVTINPKNTLANFFEGFNIYLHFNEENNTVIGSFSLQWHIKKTDLFSETKNIAINNLIHTFCKNNMHEISFMQIINCFSKTKINKHGEIVLKSCAFKQKWQNVVAEKYPFSTASKDLEKINDFFDALFVMLLLVCHLNKNLLWLCEKTDSFEWKPSQKTALFKANDSGAYLARMLLFLNDWYNENQAITTADIENVNEVEDIGKLVEKYSTNQPQKLSLNSTVYVLQTKQKQFFLKNDFFFNNNEAKLFFLITMKPNVFGLDDTAIANNLNLKKISDFFKEIDFNDEDILNDFKQEQEKLLVRRTFNQLLFMNKNTEILSVVDDKQKSVIHNIVWTITYSKAIMLKAFDYSKAFEKNRTSDPSLLRSNLTVINRLRYLSEYFQNASLKYDLLYTKAKQYMQIDKFINDMIRKVNHEDEIFGKFKERIYLSLGIISAVVFGIVEFFNCVWTILTVSQEVVDKSVLDPRNIIFISIGTILVLFLLVTILVFMTRRLYLFEINKKHKN
ncbi:MPN337 family protein [Mycoplasmoides genitalium]